MSLHLPTHRTPKKTSIAQCKLDGKLAMMVSTINLNLDKCEEAATNILKVEFPSTTTTMGATVMEFQLSNQRLQAK